jgi:hypothetical protein
MSCEYTVSNAPIREGTHVHRECNALSAAECAHGDG